MPRILTGNGSGRERGEQERPPAEPILWPDRFGARPVYPALACVARGTWPNRIPSLDDDVRRIRDRPHEPNMPETSGLQFGVPADPEVAARWLGEESVMRLEKVGHCLTASRQWQRAFHAERATQDRDRVDRIGATPGIARAEAARLQDTLNVWPGVRARRHFGRAFRLRCDRERELHDVERDVIQVLSAGVQGRRDRRSPR